MANGDDKCWFLETIHLIYITTFETVQFRMYVNRSTMFNKCLDFNPFCFPDNLILRIINVRMCEKHVHEKLFTKIPFLFSNEVHDRCTVCCNVMLIAWYIIVHLPESTKSCTASFLPCHAAMWSGDILWWANRFKSAPFFISISSNLTDPCLSEEKSSSSYCSYWTPSFKTPTVTITSFLKNRSTWTWAHLAFGY